MIFRLEQVIHEIRIHSSKEMTKILCTVADAYPQQVLVALRTIIWPDLITQRIKFSELFLNWGILDDVKA